MLVSNEFEVSQPVDKVWEFFGNVPQVAACLPGAELTEDLGDETYGGTVGVRMGPVKLQFAGKAKILERDDAAKKMVIDAAGADQKGRGQAAMTITAQLTSAGSGTNPRSPLVSPAAERNPPRRAYSTSDAKSGSSRMPEASAPDTT